MGDQPNPAAVTAIPAPAQPAFQVPDGKALIDAAEYETHRRNGERLRGMEGYFQAGSKYGFKGPRDFEPYGKLHGLMTERGIGMDDIVEAITNFGQPKGQAPQQEGAPASAAQLRKELAGDFVSRADMEKLLAERDTRVEARSAHQLAKAKEEEYINKAIAGLLGEKPSDYDKMAIPSMFRELMGKSPRFYPPEHPLAEDQYMSHDEASLKPFIEQIVKIRGLSAGAEVAQLGKDAAAGKKTPAPAGSSSHSKPDTTADKKRERPDGRPHPDDVQAAFDERQKKRGQPTMSAAGG